MKNFVMPCVLALSLAACTTASQTHLPAKQASATSAMASSAPDPTGLEQSYTNAAERYSIHFPAGWTVAEKSRSPLTYRTNAGTAFIPPDDFAKGTSFLSGEVLVETTRMPCAHFVNAIQVTMTGKTFFKGDSSTVGSKNYQRFTTYVTSNEKTRTCYSLMVYVRGCSMGTACGQDHLNSFDSKELNKLVEKIVGSFRML